MKNRGSLVVSQACPTPSGLIAIRSATQSHRLSAYCKSYDTIVRQLRSARGHSRGVQASSETHQAVPRQNADDKQNLSGVLQFSGVLATALTVLEAASVAAALILIISRLRVIIRQKASHSGSQEVQNSVSQLRAEDVFLAPSNVISTTDYSVFFIALALAFDILLRLWTSFRSVHRKSGDSSSAYGTARLMRLEILQTRQAAALTATVRDLQKMHIRVQTMSRDLQPAVRQVQAESAVHAEAVNKVVDRLEGLGVQIEDTRALIADLQGASMKQLKLLVHALDIARQDV